MNKIFCFYITLICFSLNAMNSLNLDQFTQRDCFHIILFDACTYNNKTILELLFNQDINVNVQDENGDTPLMYAVINGNIDAVKLLLSCKNLNLDVKNNKNETALSIALKNQQYEIKKVLILEISHRLAISRSLLESTK